MFDFLGGGNYRDPDRIMAEAYGVNPEVLQLQRLQSLSNMGTLLTAAAGGADSNTVMKAIIDGGNENQQLREMAQLRLTGAQVKNAERDLARKEASDKREAAMQDFVAREFFGGSIPGLSAGVAGPASIAAAAGIPITPAGAPGGVPGAVPPGMAPGGQPTVPAGQPIGNTPLDPNNLPVVVPGAAEAYSNLTPPQAGMLGQAPMAQRAAASQGIAAQLRAAGIPEAAVRGVGLMLMKDWTKGIEKANEYLMRKRVVETSRTDSGKIVQKDSDGFTTVVDAADMTELERRRRMEAGVDIEKEYAVRPTITAAPEVVNGKRVYRDQYGTPTVIDVPSAADEEAKLRRTEQSDARKGLDKDGLAALKTASEGARSAVGSIEKMNMARELINSGVYSLNWKGDATTQSYLTTKFGGWIPGFNDMDAAARTAALQSLGRSMAKEAIKGLGSQPTDADLRVAMEVAGADPDKLSPKQMLRIFEANEKMARGTIDKYNERRDAFAKGLPEQDRPRLESNGYGRVEAPRYSEVITLPDGRRGRAIIDTTTHKVISVEPL